MLDKLKRASFKHKNNKPWYYLKNHFRLVLPKGPYQKNLLSKIDFLTKRCDMKEVEKRLAYYNKLERNYDLPETAEKLTDFKLKNHFKVYYFDAFEYTRYFPSNFRICPLFGDIIHVPDVPSLVKSRPIEGDNVNSVVMKLEKIRHFLFINDKKTFEEKKNMLIGRGKVRQPHRIRFMEMYYKHPMCNLGQVNRTKEARFPAPRLTIEEHLIINSSCASKGMMWQAT